MLGLGAEMSKFGLTIFRELPANYLPRQSTFGGDLHCANSLMLAIANTPLAGNVLPPCILGLGADMPMFGLNIW